MAHAGCGTYGAVLVASARSTWTIASASSGTTAKGTGARRRERGKAHTGAVNGITWAEDGQYLVTTGRDERMRVWNMMTGANTLANFGPALKNSSNTMLTPLLPPAAFSSSSTILYPNPWRDTEP